MEKLYLQLLEILNMKKLLLISLLLISFSSYAQDGFYVDTGIGWMQNLPVAAKVTVEVEAQEYSAIYTSREQASIPVESPFFYLAGGYETNNWHFEFSRAGIPDDTEASITEFKIYKRFYF